MTFEDRQKLLKELGSSSYGEALREHIREALDEVGDVEQCTTWEDTLGRKHAKTFLSGTFSFLYKKEAPTSSRNQYT